MDRALHLVVIVLVIAILAGGSGRAFGMPNNIATRSNACWLLAIFHQEWETLLAWKIAGDIKKLPPREAAHDPCRPVEPKARTRKFGR